MILLQIDSSDALGYFIGSIIAFVVCIFITRWIFRIDTMVHYAKIQADLLIKIAKYNNVPHDEIYQVLGMTNPNPKAIIPNDDFDAGICSIITDAGVHPAINYLMEMKSMSPGSARTYVDELIEKNNLTPKKGY